MGADPKHGPPIRRLPQHFSLLCRLTHESANTRWWSGVCSAWPR